jgi:predicted RNase H-like nuclease (RuvC/YqgF family)
MTIDTALETVKRHLGRTAAIVAAVATIIAAGYAGATWVDARWEKAEDAREFREKMDLFAKGEQQQRAQDRTESARSFEINRLNGEKVGLNLRREALKDRVYDLQSRPALAQHERAMLARYLADVDDLGRQIRALERRIAELQGAR